MKKLMMIVCLLSQPAHAGPYDHLRLPRPAWVAGGVDICPLRGACIQTPEDREDAVTLLSFEHGDPDMDAVVLWRGAKYMVHVRHLAVEGGPHGRTSLNCYAVWGRCR